MYVPKQFEERDVTVLHDLLRAHPLGAWVTQVDGELGANHVPFLLDPTRGEFGTLMCHVARSNPVWQVPAPSLFIFQGAEAYISPSWYPSKRAHGKVVPTWNYAVVHAHGTPQVMDDRDWLLQHLTQMSEKHESGQAVPWEVSDAPPEFIQGLLDVIVGIEIPLTRLVGKWKVSQNRSLADRLGVVAGLTEVGDEGAQAMAQLVHGHAGPLSAPSKS
jgi:transcriptional regulator